MQTMKQTKNQIEEDETKNPKQIQKNVYEEETTYEYQTKQIDLNRI